MQGEARTRLLTRRGHRYSCWLLACWVLGLLACAPSQAPPRHARVSQPRRRQRGTPLPPASLSQPRARQPAPVLAAHVLVVEENRL